MGLSANRKHLNKKTVYFIIVAMLLKTVIDATTAQAAISFVSSSSANNGSGATTLTIPTPAGAQIGHVMIISVDFRKYSGDGFSSMGGAVSALATHTDGTDMIKKTYYKVFTATPASSFTMTFGTDDIGSTTSTKASGGAIVYSGVDTSAPIIASAGQANTSSTTVTTPSINVTYNNAMVVALFGAAIGTTTTEGSSMTKRFENASTGGSTGSRTTSMAQDIIQTSSGASGAKSATLGAAGVSIGQIVALTPSGGSQTPSTTLAQEAYRFYLNANSNSPGAALAAANTPSSISSATPFRLRMLVDVADADLAVGASNFVLQAGEKVSTCSAATYSNATNFFDNASVADNATITTSANDPQASGGGAAEIPQTYNENNAFTSVSNTPAGDSALWDFSLTSASGDAGKTYCFRVVISGGTPLSSYMVYPEISFTAGGGGGTPSSIYMIPDGDIASVGWGSLSGISGSCAGGTKCDLVDEGVNPDGGYINTGTTNGADGDYVEFSMTAPTDVSSASQLVVSINAATYAIEGSADSLNINLRVNGTLMTAVTTPALQFYGNEWYTATFSGTWSQSDVNSMQVLISRNALGGGQASSRDDDAVLDTVYGSLTYSGTGARSTLGQEAYRLYENYDFDNPGAPLAPDNTAATILAQTPFRLRMLIDVASMNLPAGAARLILQRGEKISTCGSATYIDAVDFYDNPNVTDDDLSSNTSIHPDPVPSGGGAVVIDQTFNENNEFENIFSIPIGDSGLWEFSLTSLAGDAGKTYCYRAVYATGTAIASYSVYPEITFTSSGPTLNQQMRGGQSVNNGTKSPLVW